MLCQIWKPFRSCASTDSKSDDQTQKLYGQQIWWPDSKVIRSDKHLLKWEVLTTSDYSHLPSSMGYLNWFYKESFGLIYCINAYEPVWEKIL